MRLPSTSGPGPLDAVLPLYTIGPSSLSNVCLRPCGALAMGTAQNGPGVTEGTAAYVILS